MITVKSPIPIIASFLWVGFICAISFMEAWLKFRAPGITLPLGLGIGRIVFKALNKVEWIFAITIILTILIWEKANLWKWENLFIIVAISILVIQTVWLLPVLDKRAELYIKNEILPSSNVHLYYIIVEVIKTICIIIFGISLFKCSSI